MKIAQERRKVVFINKVGASENMRGHPQWIFCTSTEFLNFFPKVTLSFRNTMTLTGKCHGFLLVFVSHDKGPDATLVR